MLTAVKWGAASFGVLSYNVLHFFSYMSDAFRSQRDPAIARVEVFDAGAMWGFGISLALVVLPILLPLNRAKFFVVVGALIGGLIGGVHTMVGLYHGIHDGAGYLAVAAIVSVSTPSVIAIRSSRDSCARAQRIESAQKPRN